MELLGFVEVSEVLRCGVYALVHKGQVVYVGKSKTMLGRLYTHRQQWLAKRRKKEDQAWWIRTPGIDYDEVHVQPCHPDRLDGLERDMINRYKPRFNQLLKDDSKITQPIALCIGGQTIMMNSPRALSAPIARRI